MNIFFLLYQVVRFRTSLFLVTSLIAVNILKFVTSSKALKVFKDFDFKIGVKNCNFHNINPSDKRPMSYYFNM